MSITNFNNIISSSFLQIFNDAIDSLLKQNSLSLPCTLHYNNGSQDYCNNCVFDQITKISSNIYNGSGPYSFTDNTICPVCMGLGLVQNNNLTDIVYLGIVFDGKYFIGLNNKTVNIADGTIQTLCSIIYSPKIKSASSLTINTTENYGNYVYERAGDPIPMGLGSTNYISTFWNRK